MKRRYVVCSGLAAVLVLTPMVASAQAIGGTVSDETGLALPGVTVEVRSPALIEQVRTAVTDGSGQYLVIALSPGTYSVTAALPGFSTVVREDILLTTGFTANIDVQLAVGTIEETITVTGETPIVDVATVTKTQVTTREVIDTVPVAKSFQSLGVLIPGIVTSGVTAGINQDVGGSSGNNHMTMAIHGGRTGDQHLQVDGMSVEAFTREDSSNLWLPNVNFQEYAFDYAANTAETETGGVRVNMIPREGSNRWSAGIFTNFSAQRLQSDNLDQTLIDGGLDDPNRLKELWSADFHFGGPIVNDRLWMVLTHSQFAADNYRAGTYFNNDVRAFVPDFDLDNQGYAEQEGFQSSLRLTAQLTPRNKVGAYWVNGEQCHCFWLIGRAFGLNIAPESSVYSNFGDQMYQLTWTSPVTSRLLLEAGASSAPQVMDWPTQPFGATDLPGILEVVGLQAYRNANAWWSATDRHYGQSIYSYRASMSYVTGSHAFKVGSTVGWGTQWTDLSNTGIDLSYLTYFGTPIIATYRATPYSIGETMHPNLGVFAQDSWTLDRLTLNGGIRFDYFQNSYPDHYEAPSRYVPVARSFPGKTVVSWRDISPRIAAVYDLSGDGRTAIKASANKYVLREAVGYARAINPIGTNISVGRAWSDANGDGIPQGDPLDPEPNGELYAPSPNLAFGTPTITTFFDEDWAFGSGLRPGQWEFSGSVQHELSTGFAVDVGVFRRVYTNFAVVDNRALGGGDISTFSVVAPLDDRLPGGGGYVIDGLVDINPDKAGQINNITTSANNFGKRTEHWNGVDVNFNARLQDVFFQGGFSTGKTSRNECDQWDSLPELQFQGRNVTPRDYCDNSTPFITSIKGLGSYTLPWGGLQLSATFQSIQGPERSANVVYTSAQVEESLGRPLSTAATIIVDVLPPGEAYGERLNQFDFRVTKTFNIGGNRLQGMFDLYNMFNANPVLFEEYALDANYLSPTAILPARMMKFGVQWDF